MKKETIWSSSKLNTYMGCSLGYYFNYELKEKVPKSAPLVFGDSIHIMLKRFYKMNYKSAESFFKQWKGFWFSDYVYGPKIKGKKKKRRQLEIFGKEELEEMSKTRKKTFNPSINFSSDAEPFIYVPIGKEILTKFYEQNKNAKKPDLTEEKFDFEFKGHKFVAKMDRIENLDGDAEILDYKTDKYKPSALTVERHPQLTIYYLAFMARYGREPKRVGIYHLRSGEKFYAERKESDFDYIDSLATRVENEVRKRDFTPFYGFHCDRMCGFKDICAKTEIKKIKDENGEYHTKITVNYPQLKINDEKITKKHSEYLKELQYSRFKQEEELPLFNHK